MIVVTVEAAATVLLDLTPLGRCGIECLWPSFLFLRVGVRLGFCCGVEAGDGRLDLGGCKSAIDDP